MEDLGVVDSINNAGSWLVRNQALLLSYAVNTAFQEGLSAEEIALM